MHIVLHVGTNQRTWRLYVVSSIFFYVRTVGCWTQGVYHRWKSLEVFRDVG
jgi:hypothetical protein